jgi:hypothetical protein
MFAGSADAKATLLCDSVAFFSRFFLRVSNQGVLSFNSGYPLWREIFKTLEWGTDKTDSSPCGHLLSVLSADHGGFSKNSRFVCEDRIGCRKWARRNGTLGDIHSIDDR